jgi:hypothetical protein
MKRGLFMFMQGRYWLRLGVCVLVAMGSLIAGGVIVLFWFALLGRSV